MADLVAAIMAVVFTMSDAENLEVSQAYFQLLPAKNILPRTQTRNVITAKTNKMAAIMFNSKLKYDEDYRNCLSIRRIPIFRVFC